MNDRARTTAVVDGVLRLLVGGSAISASLILPGLAIGLEKPLNIFFNHMDKRARQREMARILHYMKEKDLINYQGSYEHGITITDEGRERLAKADFNNLKISRPDKWDSQWRLVIFDIPEEYKTGRDGLTSKLRGLGFKVLQRSVWVHPFPCHAEIEAVALNYKLTRFITYLETSYIDYPDKLKSKFSALLKSR